MQSEESAPRSRHSIAFAFVLAVVAALLLLLMWRNRADHATPSHPGVGKQLAAVELAPLTGDAQPISPTDLQGKVTLINFWGPWCGFCLDEMPHLVRLREKFSQSPDVQFLFVSCMSDWLPDLPPALGWREDGQQLAASTSELLHQHGWNIPTWTDPRGLTRQAFASLDTWEGYPTTLLIDRDGVVQFVHIGYVPGDEYLIEKALYRLVENKPSAP